MRFSVSSFVAAACLVALCPASSRAARPSETLLPATTRGYITILNVNEMTDAWKQTLMGELLNDPAMEPFANDIRNQFEESFSMIRTRLGITWDDVRKVPAGELSVGVIRGDEGPPSVAVLIDITGRMEEAKSLLEKINGTLINEGATRSEAEVDGTEIIVYDLPDEMAGVGRQVMYCIKDNLLTASDRLETIEDILGRFSGEHEDNLEHHAPYQAVMSRCRAEMSELQPHIRWFIEPVAYLGAVQAMIPRDAGAQGEDPSRAAEIVKMLDNQGFSAIRGIGGLVNFAAGKHDVLHRTMVYAPKPYEKAMRMLKLPNVAALEPQPWVPADVALHVTFNLDIRNAFEMSASLIDEWFGEKDVLEDIIKSVRDDPDGPGIDLREDLVALLGTRVTVIVDYRRPITTTSERMLIAAETTDPARLEENIEKSMQDDPNVKRRDFEGFTIWEITEEATSDIPELDIDLGLLEDTGAAPPPAAEEPMQAQQMGLLAPHSGIAVAHGHLFVASHVSLLEKVLSAQADHEKLAGDIEYQLVSAELAQLCHADEHCVQIFHRTDESTRPTYELLKAGKMPEAETMLGSLLNMLLGSGNPEELREQKIDASQLPDFEIVRRYLGPAATCVTSEEDGWFIVGFTLNKEKP